VLKWLILKETIQNEHGYFNPNYSQNWCSDKFTTFKFSTYKSPIENLIIEPIVNLSIIGSMKNTYSKQL
jgi:hypothetical protein